MRKRDVDIKTVLEPVFFGWPADLQLRTLTDSQLRTLIAEAYEILEDRRPADPPMKGRIPLPNDRGEFIYNIQTSYGPKINEQTPEIFLLQPHNDDFVAVPLTSHPSGDERPAIIRHCAAKNGEVFKIVNANGDYSYLIPFNGRLYNPKRSDEDLSAIGKPLKRFLELVEPEAFERIRGNAHRELKRHRRCLTRYRERVRHWRDGEWANERPLAGDGLKAAQDSMELYMCSIAQKEAHIEWLEGIDRSAPTLNSVPGK